MKTTVLFLFSLLNLNLIIAQFQPIDTVYANKHQIVSLNFESPIEKGITGAEHFVFTYNREESEKLGLLQAQKGVESNLLVMTKDGGIYSFVISYRDSLAVFNHFIDPTKSLRRKPINTDVKSKTQPKTNSYNKLCKQLLGRTNQFHQIYTKGGIRLKMTESIYHNKEVYIVYELKNSSAIDYEIDQMELYKVIGTNKRRASYQEISIAPLHSFQMPKIVSQGNTIRFVVVYPKFTLGNHNSLKMSLKEKNGSRNISF